MALTDLASWLDEQTKPHIVWFIKRLSGNDTLANETHQAGPYIPKEFIFDVFPSLKRREEKNPRVQFEVFVDSHADVLKATAIWYNNKYHGQTRDEVRVTNWGGSKSALLDPESTGALVIFAFHRNSEGDGTGCHVWVCQHAIEEDVIEDRLGPIEPGKWKIWSIDKEELTLFPTPSKGCWLGFHEIPSAWLTKFPTGQEIIARTIEMDRNGQQPVDVRLVKRRECEYEIFRSVEQVIELAAVQKGFQTVDEFIARAQTILQRRKARSGRSLELHTREIFREENLKENIDFSHQPESESGKRPDFLFPSEAAYKDPNFPSEKLRMLAVKTTCKDRWRQIINEADRVSEKHLLTLQEGISESQFQEMQDANIKLIVPQSLIASYPNTVKAHLQTIESFIADVRLLRF